MPLSDKDMQSSSDALFSDVMYFRLEALVILLVYFKGSVATVLHTITQAETNVVFAYRVSSTDRGCFRKEQRRHCRRRCRLSFPSTTNGVRSPFNGLVIILAVSRFRRLSLSAR